MLQARKAKETAREGERGKGTLSGDSRRTKGKERTSGIREAQTREKSRTNNNNIKIKQNTPNRFPHVVPARGGTDQSRDKRIGSPGPSLRRTRSILLLRFVSHDPTTSGGVFRRAELGSELIVIRGLDLSWYVFNFRCCTIDMVFL